MINKRGSCMLFLLFIITAFTILLPTVFKSAALMQELAGQSITSKRHYYAVKGLIHIGRRIVPALKEEFEDVSRIQFHKQFAEWPLKGRTSWPADLWITGKNNQTVEIKAAIHISQSEQVVQTRTFLAK